MYFEILICVNLVKEDKRTWFWGDMRTREHGFGEDKRTWFFERQENMRT